MKLAQINLTRGMFIPGLGNTMKVTDVEFINMDAGGVLIVTPTAKVILPWQNIESIVTEWIALKDPPRVVESVGKVAHADQTGQRKAHEATMIAAHPDSQFARAVQAERGMAEQLAGNAQAQSARGGGLASDSATQAQAQSILQPPPPAKKGGKAK